MTDDSQAWKWHYHKASLCHPFRAVLLDASLSGGAEFCEHVGSVKGSHPRLPSTTPSVSARNVQSLGARNAGATSALPSSPSVAQAPPRFPSPPSQPPHPSS